MRGDEINLTAKLTPLSSPETFPDKPHPHKRWGQILRTPPALTRLLDEACAPGFLTPLRLLAEIRSGLVTRANDFFLVNVLRFDQIPNSCRVAKRDFDLGVAVFIDSRNTPHRMLRKHLRPAIKGPDALLGPTKIAPSSLHVVDIAASPADLQRDRDHDAEKYISRGRTTSFNGSPDKLKGGIPAERANVKTRKPYWYSLNVPVPPPGRLIIPEHTHERFVVTAVPEDNTGVVIDTLYVIGPSDPAHQWMINAGMNSVLAWYQLELRGRTQHGQGVLKVKIPDIGGVLVLNPAAVPGPALDRLRKAWAPLEKRGTKIVGEELLEQDRIDFEIAYLETLGIAPDRAKELAFLFAGALRQAMEERKTRAVSLAEQKTQKAPRQRASRAIDAFASRIVTRIDPYPDPRNFVGTRPLTVAVPVSPFDGALTLGEGLFESATVFAGTDVVAVAADRDTARFVRAVLTIDPQLTVVDAPDPKGVANVMAQWTEAVAVWWKSFSKACAFVTAQIADDRMVAAVTKRALALAHASELPLEAGEPG